MEEIKRELYIKLKKFNNDKDFVGGVISITKNDKERQAIIDFIDKGEDVTVEAITLLALHLKKNRNNK